MHKLILFLEVLSIHNIIQVSPDLAQMLQVLRPISCGVGGQVTSQTIILHSIPHTIAIRGHGGKPSHQDRIRGEGAGGEDDVVGVGVGRVFKEGHGHHPLLLCQRLEGKEVSVKSLTCCHDDKHTDNTKHQ